MILMRIPSMSSAELTYPFVHAAGVITQNNAAPYLVTLGQAVTVRHCIINAVLYQKLRQQVVL